MRRLFTVLVVLVTLGCGGKRIPEPRPATITDSASCDPACEHLRDLRCEEGNDIHMPDDTKVTCAQWCKETQSNGVWLNPKCVEKITQCSQIETCAEKK